MLNAALAPLMVVAPKLLDSLGAGARGYGVFMALDGVGMLLAGLLVAAMGPRLPLRRTSALGFALTASVFAVMWHWPQLPVMLTGAALLGLGFGLLNIPNMTLVQQMVPPHYLARVMSVLIMVSSLAMPASLLLLSPLLDRYPLPMWFGLAAVLMALGPVGWIAVVLSERELPDLNRVTALGQTS